MRKSSLNQFLRIARDKLDAHPQFMAFPHFSFIVQNNRLLGWATNASHTPPIHFGYHDHPDKNYRPKLHAELRVYHKVRGILEPGDFEMVNIRLNKTGELRLSKPCNKCFCLISRFGCSKFYYSSETGFAKFNSRAGV